MLERAQRQRQRQSDLRQRECRGRESAERLKE
jgi:hypothetical protein